MSNLFKIQGKIVVPNPETLLISPFKEIWERDTTEKKVVATQELTYIEFIGSALKSNPYKDYEEEVKIVKVTEDIIKEKDWEPDDLVLSGISKVKEFQTEGSLSYQYWVGSKRAAEKILEFFNSFDMDERNLKTNAPIYKPGDITRAIKDASQTLESLNTLKKKVEEELYETSRNRADKEVSPFAQSGS